MTPASWVRRLAVAARPSPPWWHVTVPSWLARLLVAGGARAAASRPGGPAPEAWDAAGRWHARNTVYYYGRAVLVTAEAMEVKAPSRQRFLIRELHDVRSEEHTSELQSR